MAKYPKKAFVRLEYPFSTAVEFTKWCRNYCVTVHTASTAFQAADMYVSETELRSVSGYLISQWDEV